jgi:N-acetylmuramoyl-L-alanine amidase CwlA
VVIHYTGNTKDTAINNCRYYEGKNREASAHFFVDENSIYQSVSLKNVAWHCGGSTYYHAECRNANSFGIEMCCTAGNYKISTKTLQNSAYLCANLCKRAGITAANVDKYVLRHYDVTHKKCPAQMANSANDADWVAFKKMVKNILTNGTLVATTTTVVRKDETVVKTNYQVRVTADALNIRKGPGTSYATNGVITDKGVYTIVEEQKVGNTTWGKLKSGAGWISLAYTKKI